MYAKNFLKIDDVTRLLAFPPLQLQVPSFMVAVSPPVEVLVTGANGYLATWVVKKYIEAGYSVRGAVCSLPKSTFLNDKSSHYGNRSRISPRMVHLTMRSRR